DPDRVDDPMMVNPAPFAERPDAVAYVEAVDYLSEDDIVQLAEIDRDTATFYRERFFEDDADETGDDES
ncbi:MAG: nitrous oxide reductase accessory protein NosL, partial [Halobacteriota archaeon]